MEDPDAPKGTFTHWVMWDILNQDSIGEDTNPGVSGVNSNGKTGYYPPAPPSGYHRYIFHVYALDCTIGLPPGANRKALESAMHGHILAEGALMGRYSRATQSAH
jgi:Raf kinase inhibitor-like YbhB/YbcL family protein